jgi:hypothetical protein
MVENFISDWQEISNFNWQQISFITNNEISRFQTGLSKEFTESRNDEDDRTERIDRTDRTERIDRNESEGTNDVGNSGIEFHDGRFFGI